MKRQASAITIVAMKVPDGESWQAQVHLEWKGRPGKDVLPLFGDSAGQILRRACDAVEKKLSKEAIVLS